MLQPVHEPIDAYVIYRKEARHPILRAFHWGQRRYDVTAINLVYPEREGKTRYLCYAVSCGKDQFRLRLNTTRSRWTLDAIDVEG